MPPPSKTLQQKAYNEALEKIEGFRRSRARHLDLDDLDLTRLPPEIGRLDQLTSLSLDNNQLSALPPEIGQLANLTSLSVDNNQLSALPPEIGQLANLTSLSINGNQLSTLPSEIGQLANLTTLFLSSNRLNLLPPWIGQLADLAVLHLNYNEVSGLPPEIGRLANLSTLSLDGNPLVTLPREIAQLAKLTSLSLNGTVMTTLPPEIGQLASLRELYLVSNSELSTLPPEIGQLGNLTTLFLLNNRLTSLPTEIFQLTNLTGFYFSHNKLNALPPQIGQLASLRKLHVSDCALTHLPAEVGQLVKLTELYLTNNQLTRLPPEIGQLANLTELSLTNNKLSTLPAEIGQLVNLTNLSVADNQLTRLPPEMGRLANLKRLSLNNNQLRDLPPQIGQLTKLTELFLHDNVPLGIPDSILGSTSLEVFGPERKAAARPEDILNFYFAQLQGAAEGTLRAVNEIKVMLVGRGGAGKTSLRRFFMGEPHDKAEPETPGIALDSFELTCAKNKMTVRLWDFAGQEITHALHQFFLTEGCVYILVLDPRSNTEMQDAEYWLGLLKRYAGGAPVVVALNRQDARQGGYDVDRRVLQERFSFVQSFTATNCEKREGCEKLQQRLCDAIESLKDTEPPKLKVPETWLKVMEDCTAEAQRKPQSTGNRLAQWLGLSGAEEVRSIGRQHLTLNEFREICAKRGEKDPAKQESLARLLHKLGAVLHFVDEPRLRDTTVLNPHWVTDGVYRLLRFKDRPGSDGTLTLAEALEALPSETEETVRFLLRLMERFEMCFPLDDEDGDLPTSWLIPGALGEFQPEGVTTEWQRPGSVRLRYVYDPLPEGVLPRFIVLTHLLSEEKPRWRNGVVLEDGQAAALVRRGEKRNHVEVTAFGPEAERLRLLEIIQGNLERIHSDLPDPKPVAEVELAGLPGIFRPVADLEVAELGKQEVAVKTPQGDVLVKPGLQLNQTSEPESRSEGRVPLNAFLSYSHKDKKAKEIFQQNLTVMTKKKLITSWHDGLIEPGMRWREEIEENLGRMDVFIGLLTTEFLASDFIGTVEIQAARNKLSEKGKDFLFVLILVDDISLEALDLAGYQIMVPGGKAISKYPSRKEGFNMAQKELEQLILKRQAKRKQEKQDESPTQLPTRVQAQEGITIIVQGDYIKGDKPMTHDQSINIGGNVINSQVGQTLANCMNVVQQQAPGDRKTLLEELTRQVEQLVRALPQEKQEEAAANLELAVKAATGPKPNRPWYSVSAEGLMEAATYVKDFSENIAATLKNLGKTLWPDFLLPGGNN